MASDIRLGESNDSWIVHPIVLVKYPKGDLIGMFFGYYSLLVYQIQAIYVTLFLRNRDLLTFYCCFTHLLSEIINYILKHLIKQPRPDHGAPGGGLFEGRYGMPSQHCHCFAFLVTMSLLLVFHYYRKYIDLKWKLFTITTSSIALTLQVIGRIYLRFHTTEQCMVGVAVGSLLATTFYLFGTHYFLPYTEQLCELKILRILSFRRDLVTEPPSFKPKPISKSIKTRKRRSMMNTASWTKPMMKVDVEKVSDKKMN